MIAIIAAVAKNGVIGHKGKIPWSLPEDLKHFRELTTGNGGSMDAEAKNVIVMGRRTYEEIGHPLPDRMNYLISSTLHVEGENCRTAASLAEVLELEAGQNIFICGGQMLYREALPVADRLFLTELSWPVEGDTFFPSWNRENFRLTAKKACPNEIGQAWFCEYRANHFKRADSSLLSSSKPGLPSRANIFFL